MLGFALVAIAALGLAIPLAAENSTTAGTQKGEWRYWGGDEGSSRYSPLDQINAENFGDLEIAWRWKADNYGPSVDYIYRSTPIYVNGKLYTVAALGLLHHSRVGIGRAHAFYAAFGGFQLGVLLQR